MLIYIAIFLLLFLPLFFADKPQLGLEVKTITLNGINDHLYQKYSTLLVAVCV